MKSKRVNIDLITLGFIIYPDCVLYIERRNVFRLFEAFEVSDNNEIIGLLILSYELTFFVGLVFL